MKILIVDDEPMMIESIRIGLKRKGYKVLEANSVQKALDLLFREGDMIDLIITDYLMPATNGMDLLMAVRRSNPTLPVIMMTGYADTRLLIKAMNNQCSGFIEKPFSLQQLIYEIARVMNSNPKEQEDGCRASRVELPEQ